MNVDWWLEGWEVLGRSIEFGFGVCESRIGRGLLFSDRALIFWEMRQ